MNRRATWIVVAMMGAIEGCSSEHRVEFDAETSPPGFVRLDGGGVSIAEGLGVVAIVQPIEDDELMDVDTRVDAAALDPSVMGVFKVDVSGGLVEDDQSPEWAFVFVGVSTGSTSLRFEIEYDDDLHVVELPGSVVEPEGD